MEKSLPYPIPGPAGTLPAPRRQSSASPSLQQTDCFSVFSWRKMQQSLGLPPYGSHRLEASLVLLRRNALLNFRHKLSNLPVLVDSLHWVGHDASVTLRDPTASMSATIYATVFADYAKSPIRVGTALILQDVIAFAYSNRSVGFRADPLAAVHLNIRPAHIQTIISIPDLLPLQNSLQTPPPRPSDLYTPFAFSPQMPPIRARRTVPTTPQHLPAPQATSRPLLPHNSLPTSTHPKHAAPFVPPSRKRPLTPHPANPARNPLVVNQPLSKRAMLPVSGPMTSNHNVPSNSTALKNSAIMSGLTDDHLDSILGDLDLEAVIAAHEKSQPGEKISTTIANTLETSKHHTQQKLSLNTESKPSQPQLIVPPLVKSSEAPPVNSEHTPLNATVQCLSPSKDCNIPNSTAESESVAVVSRDPFSAVDDDMIQSLFDGLDASDFG